MSTADLKTRSPYQCYHHCEHSFDWSSNVQLISPRPPYRYPQPFLTFSTMLLCNIYIIYNINSYIIATTWLFTSAVLHLSTPFGSWSQLNPVDSSTHLRFGGFLVNQLPWNPNGYPNEKLHFLDLILSLGLKTSFAHILWSPHQYVIICPYPLLWMRT